MGSRYLPNDSSDLLTLSNPEDYLVAALEDIVGNYRPKQVYSLGAEKLSGLWTGPTGIAYLFLHASSMYPHLKIAEHHVLTWARNYMRGRPDIISLEPGRCGIASEKLASEAVQASISKDLAHVQRFLSNIPSILNGDYPDEILQGRAGTLYMLRMISHWVPNSLDLVNPSINAICEKILSDGPTWKWHGNRYLGAIHGDVGIVTQLILTKPSLASQLEPKLTELLDRQLANGNWPSSEGKETSSLTQFCHGAPGFVHSLVSLRPYFPKLQETIDQCVKRSRECTWRQGLLRKEPSLCHGLFGNALALSSGPRRCHFLALATPEKVAEMRKADKTIFQRADYGSKYATIAGYCPSAAWAWMVCKKESPTIILYNDI